MRNTYRGLFALTLLGSIFAYRNRSRIISFMKSKGVSLPDLSNSSIVDKVSEVGHRISDLSRSSDMTGTNNRSIRRTG